MAAYLGTWLFACFVAVMLGFMFRCRLTLFTKMYISFITVRWKWISFVIAASGMTVIAPYIGDPTRNYVDALFMSVLTYLTAPWVIGVLYQGIKGKQPLSVIYIAICCWLFSASWSYDLYILLRDGMYPITWWTNLQLSSILYICAGMMWNLEYWPGTGVKFGFMRDEWPTPNLKAL
ncbi:MAG: hypothetical protein EP297_05410 [Gammaproteobacteria bacterium]|nr:MAG: hypothetical protein EP297_05410 [Gammaproteobacteria bacterium]